MPDTSNPWKSFLAMGACLSAPRGRVALLPPCAIRLLHVFETYRAAGPQRTPPLTGGPQPPSPAQRRVSGPHPSVATPAAANSTLRHRALPCRAPQTFHLNVHPDPQAGKLGFIRLPDMLVTPHRGDEVGPLTQTDHENRVRQDRGPARFRGAFRM